jgi:uncharacterized protein (TIGR03084 family)
MAISIDTLVAHLLDETRALDGVLGALADGQWDVQTPAPGWLVRDQVSHIAYFDDATVVAVLEPERFERERVEAVVDIDAFTARVAAEHRGCDSASLMQWFRDARRRLVDTLAPLDVADRVPWYGPAMSVPTALTARIMETWAHGQDVVDAVGATRPPTPALRHVAHLGVRTFANSFTTRGLPVPDAPVRVALTGPDGTSWEWGPVDAAEEVRGPALDFCLVVTQRRHPDDTRLVVQGAAARQWMEIAQAFAGPPGAGRAPGQFDAP